MAEQAPEEFPVVALVASAGGLEATSEILEGLPRAFPAPVIVLIHQQPDHVSLMVAILGRRCRLPVSETRHDAPLIPGHVMVVPAGRHLLIAPGGRTVLIRSGDAPPSRPSADLLLATLATALGNRAIAVILSGGGHDGATGATAVHVCGGIVLATDHASSANFSMPLAAIERDAAVDRVLPLNGVAGALTKLAGRRSAQEPARPRE